MVENEKNIKKNVFWIKAQQKSSLEETRGALRRRSSEYLSDPDPVTHRKKESRYYYYSSGASIANRGEQYTYT